MRPIRLLPDTAAVIVTHRRTDLAQGCAERILEEIAPSSIVVVVNDPENAPAAELEWLSANVGFVVRNKSQLGYGANMNRGVRCLRGRCRYYLLLNDDVVPARGSIAALRLALERDSSAAVAAPQLVDGNGRHEQLAYRYPTVASELASALIAPAPIQDWLWRTFILGNADGARARSDIWLPGAALLVRSSVFHEVKGFDEDFFLYSEETDLSFRLREQGWGVLPCKEVFAIHLGGTSTTDRRYRRLMGVARSTYIRKHWPWGARVVLTAVLALAYAWNSVYMLVRVIVSPRSSQDRLAVWMSHWDKRPHVARLGR